MATKKWTERDIPDMAGRTAVITGANTGLGLETARSLAGKGAFVVLAVRNSTKGEAAAQSIRSTHPDAAVEIQSLDLGSLTSVRAAAQEITAAHPAIDLLINNAGVMYTERSLTEDGFELQIGINHLGHFALTGLLMDALTAADRARVVSVSSVGHKVLSTIDFDDLQGEKRYNRVAAYGRSKLANLLFTYELQRRCAAAGTSVSALAAHPGVAATELARNSPAPIRLSEKFMKPLLQPASMGALPTLRAATDPAAIGGQYFGPDGFAEFRGHPVVVSSNAASHDVETQAKLWSVSETLTGVTFPI